MCRRKGCALIDIRQDLVKRWQRERSLVGLASSRIIADTLRILELPSGSLNLCLNKVFRVLGHAKSFEPVCNLLHRDRRGRNPSEFSSTATNSLYR